MVAKSGGEGRQGRRRREARRESGQHWHVGEIEATGGTSSNVMIVHRKVAVAIGIGAGRRDMRRVENIGVN